MKRFQKDEHFREYLLKFSNSSASQEESGEAGECALLMLYGERSDANLNNIRYDAFCKKISTRNFSLQKCTPMFGSCKGLSLFGQLFCIM